MSKSTKVIFIPGNGGGTVKDHWFPWLKIKLEQLGVHVVSRDFPDRFLAREKFWLPFLSKQLKADENTIIIGHSSGAVAALRYAEKNTILGSVLVSACYTDLNDENERKSGYYNHPWNWQAIRNNQKWIIQFHSLDDPYIPISEARFIHQKLGTQYKEFKRQKHFGSNGNKDKKTFPSLFNALKKRLVS